MNKKLINPILNIIAMIFLILSRIISDDGFDWIAIIALVILLLSVGSMIYIIKKPNRK